MDNSQLEDFCADPGCLEPRFPGSYFCEKHLEEQTGESADPASAELPRVDALAEARNYLEQYQYRINQDSYRGDLESRTRYEDAAYKEGMLNAAIAQAEQLKRIADALYARPLPDGSPLGIASVIENVGLGAY